MKTHLIGNSTVAILALESSTGSATTSAAAPATPSLPEPSMSGDIGMQLATLMLQTNYQQRKNDQQERQSAMSTMKASQATELSNMKTEADEKYTAAQESAWAQIGEGAITIASAVAPVAMPSIGGSLNLDTRVTALLSNSGFDSAIGKGASGIIGGIVGLDSAEHTKKAADADTAAKAADFAATRAKAAADDASDDKKSVNDTLSRIYDWLKSMKDAEAQTKQQIKIAG